MFDTELNALGVIEAITSLIWTRRYQTAGEMSLLVPYREDYAELLTDGNLLVMQGTAEAMQICYCHISQDAQGMEQLELRGISLMSWLNRRILLRQIVSSGQSGQQIIRHMIAENLTAPVDARRQIPHTVLSAPPLDMGEAIGDYASEERANLLDAVEGLLSTAGLGFTVHTDVAAKLHRFDVYQGRNLTTGQTMLEPCIFSAEFDTLGAHSYTRGSEALKSTAYVHGAETAATVGDEAEGLSRREMAVEASDIAAQYADADGMEQTRTPEQVASALTQRGSEELRKALEELTFEGTLNDAAQTSYQTDFDIGDRVTCINRRWGVALDVRISEITLTVQGNKHEITVTFGEGTPSLKTAIRQMAKGR